MTVLTFIVFIQQSHDCDAKMKTAILLIGSSVAYFAQASSYYSQMQI